MKRMHYVRMFDEQEFVLVCCKSDYENNNIGDGVFLVLREEWEDADDDSIKTFDLLLTSVENRCDCSELLSDGLLLLYTCVSYCLIFRVLHLFGAKE